MPATLTPLHRFSPRLHTAIPPADEASAVDVPIPLPAPTLTTPWPPRRGGATFSLPSLDHLDAGAAAMDAGDRTHAGPGASGAMDAARRESYAAGMQAGLAEGRAVGLREGAERRSWWDVVVGLTLGAALTTAIIMGGIELGMLAGAAAASSPPAPRAPAVFTEPMTGEQRA